MENFVARQPIFDAQNDVYAYELLYRKDTAKNVFDGSVDPDQASIRTIINGFMEIGLEKLTSGRKAFVNFTEKLLLDDIPNLLPPELLVVEILENIRPTTEVLAACARLRQAGFQIALDDFVLCADNRAFLDYADIVKMDFLSTPLEDIADFVCDVQWQQQSGKADRPLRLLAEKIETNGIFNVAKDMGFVYFQGYYFSKPVIVAGRSISPTAANRIRMLQLSMNSNFDFDEIEDVIKQDVALSYRLLKFVNSAYFSFRTTITNIQQALVKLGETEVRKWIALMCLLEFNLDKTPELARMALVRAYFLELIAPFVGKASRKEHLYLLGMFSLMDAIMEMPMKEVFEQIPVNEVVATPLLSRQGADYELLRLIESYERGDFEAASEQAAALALPENKLVGAYVEAVQWSSILGI